MATARSIAIRRDEAQQRLMAAATVLAGRLGIAVPAVPHHREPEILRAMEMETAAELVESVVRVLMEQAPASAAVPISRKKAT